MAEVWVDFLPLAALLLKQAGVQLPADAVEDDIGGDGGGGGQQHHHQVHHVVPRLDQNQVTSMVFTGAIASQYSTRQFVPGPSMSSIVPYAN